MKLVVDLRWVRSERIDGIGRFSLGLTEALIKKERGVVILYHQEKLLPILKEHLGKKVTYRQVPFDILTINDFIKLPAFLRQLGATYYLTPNFITSFWHRGYKVIVIVNDLIPFLYPESLNNPSLPWRIFFLTKIPTKLILGNTTAILTISQSTKEDLQSVLGVPAGKITVIYPGFKVKPVKLGNQTHILYLGRMEPYKNLGQLIRSYAALPTKLRAKFDLILAGPTKEPYFTELRELSKSLGVETRTKFLGYVDEKKVVELFSHAALFVYPSLYEGFGLPVVEARLRGVPVVTSQTSSLPEAADGGAVLVNPDDTTELAVAIEKVLTDDPLRRELLAQNEGLPERFSWDKSAEIVRELMESI